VFPQIQPAALWNVINTSTTAGPLAAEQRLISSRAWTSAMLCGRAVTNHGIERIRDGKDACSEGICSSFNPRDNPSRQKFLVRETISAASRRNGMRISSCSDFAVFAHDLLFVVVPGTRLRRMPSGMASCRYRGGKQHAPGWADTDRHGHGSRNRNAERGDRWQCPSVSASFRSRALPRASSVSS